MTSTPVHAVAKEGFGIGNELYDKARPSYPPAVLAYIRNAAASSKSLNIVEIGPGTGIFTRALLAHPDWSASVHALRAVEPSAGMRSVFTQTVTDPRVSVANGAFDATGVEDGWADLIVIAQAFHWCPDYNSAAAEFARTLKPDGVVALVWNLEDRDAVPWVAQLRDRIEQHEAGTPQFRLGLWRATFSTPAYTTLFREPVERTWTIALPGTSDIVVNRALSKSYIALLPDEEREKVVRDIRDIVARGDGRKWLNEAEGVFEYPYKTYVVIAGKK